MDVYEGAEKVVNLCANVRPGEKVAVIRDYKRPKIVAESIAKAAEALGADVTAVDFDGVLVNGEVNSDIGKIMEAAQALFCVTSLSMAYTSAVAICRKNGGRVLVLTEGTEETLASGSIEADFLSLAPAIKFVTESFNNAETVTVSAPGGTNMTLSLKGRHAASCSGICHNPGELTGIPDIEVFIAPVESETRGVLVADVTISRLGLLKETVTLDIEDGKAVSIRGGEQAEALRELLESTDCDNSYIIAEFALGLNPLGEFTGNIISDEGLYGTGHFALGYNLSFGGANQSPLHIDMVFKTPTVHLDGVLFMKDGVLCDFEL